MRAVSSSGGVAARDKTEVDSLKFLDRTTAGITKATTAISAGGLVVTTLCLFLQVIFRLLAITATWTSEIARYAFMVTVFYGLAAATDRGLHLVITIFTDRLKLRPRTWNVIFTKILLGAFLAIITYGVLLAANRAAGNNQSFEAFTGVKICYLYYVIFAGLVISTLNTFLSAAKDILHTAGKTEA